MVDSSDKQRMHEAKKELSDLLQDPLLHNAALMVLANKQDAALSMTAREVADALGLHKLPEAVSCTLQDFPSNL